MELDIESELISDYIRKCSNIIHKKGHDIAKEYDLSYDQYHLLIYLNLMKESPTIKEVAEKFNKAQNTTSERISRLEEKKLIQRLDDDQDRRVTRVILTDKGVELIEIIKKERSNKGVYLALEKMEQQEIDNLVISLTKLYDNLKRGN